MKQTFDRHMSTYIVWLAEPIRRCVRWRTQVFKIEGSVCKTRLLFHFSRGQNQESRSSVFPCSETKRKRLLRRLRSCMLHQLMKWLLGSNLSQSYFRKISVFPLNFTFSFPLFTFGPQRGVLRLSHPWRGPSLRPWLVMGVYPPRTWPLAVEFNA